MRIKSLRLENFGPFPRYEVEFAKDDSVSLLLTGRNNEGKSSIINALRLLSNATKVIGLKKQETNVNGEIVYRFLKQDTDNVKIRRIVNDYRDVIARVTARFDDGFALTVFVDPIDDLIYADRNGRIPADISEIFGFIPPLGPVGETEDVIQRKDYLIASLATSLAPRHLRNHLYQLLSASEFALVQTIIHASWPEIELLPVEVSGQGRLDCWYRERRIQRELSWAGQGLQVWIQIVTHLVRLRSRPVVILDEPEINLHPEKQNELVRLLRQYASGSIIIATHSVELMNNVHVSHILNVRKTQRKPKLKDSSDRAYLEVIRAEVGSDFNFIASQFEDVERIVFTEDASDFKALTQLANAFSVEAKAFNIPLHGFSEYKKAPSYKQAYKLLIGKTVTYRAVLDRDYYPADYLQEVEDWLQQSGIRLVLTPGKEIENTILSEDVLYNLCPQGLHKELQAYIDKAFAELYTDCHGSCITLHHEFTNPRPNVKKIITEQTPVFDQQWNNAAKRFDFVAGKAALKRFRQFFRSKNLGDLSDQRLLNSLSQKRRPVLKKFLNDVFVN